MAFRKYSAEQPSTVKVSEEERKVERDGEGEGSKQINTEADHAKEEKSKKDNHS